MSFTKLNHKGFGGLEALLIVIIIVILGGTGYYVYNSNKKANDTYTSAAKTSQSSPVKKITKKNTIPATSAKFFTIKEWNIRAPYRSGPVLIYQFTPDSNHKYASISSQELSATDAECAVSGAGLIERYSSAEHYSNTDKPVNSSDPTAQQYATSAAKSDYAHIGVYYYFYRHPQGVCGNKSSSVPLQQQAINQIKAILPKLEASPAT